MKRLIIIILITLVVLAGGLYFLDQYWIHRYDSLVAREWAAESGVAPLEQRSSMNTETFLRDPERNVQIGCWYLEKADQDYRNSPGREARVLAAYNDGPSRAAEWS